MRLFCFLQSALHGSYIHMVRMQGARTKGARRAYAALPKHMQEEFVCPPLFSTKLGSLSLPKDMCPHGQSYCYLSLTWLLVGGAAHTSATFMEPFGNLNISKTVTTTWPFGNLDVCKTVTTAGQGREVPRPI